MSSFNFQEKSLFGTLLAELAFFGYYFTHLTNTPGDFARMTGIIILFVVAVIVLQIVLAITSRGIVKDERDAIIETRGYKTSSIVLIVCILGAIVFVWMHPAPGSVAIINVLFASLMVAELAKLLSQLVLYRTSL